MYNIINLNYTWMMRMQANGLPVYMTEWLDNTFLATERRTATCETSYLHHVLSPVIQSSLHFDSHRNFGAFLYSLQKRIAWTFRLHWNSLLFYDCNWLDMWLCRDNSSLLYPLMLSLRFILHCFHLPLHSSAYHHNYTTLMEYFIW